MQKNSFTVIPTISIHPDRINHYNQVVWTTARRARASRVFSVPGAHEHAGQVSKKASRKIQKAITYLCAISRVKPLNSWKHQKVFPFRVAFVTLTLPSAQVHDDKTIMKECFHHFLVRARQLWNMKNYVWRAERQKNGNIHFHVLIDRFIPWSELRDTWNNICNKLGYVDRYRNQMKDFHKGSVHIRTDLLQSWSYKKQVKAYHEGVANDWSSPNSTDVHAVKKVQNIRQYVCKYMLKSSQADADISRLWGCSYELSRAKGAQIECDSHVYDCLSALRRLFKPVEFTRDYCSVMFVDWWHLARAGIRDLFDEFCSYIMQCFNVNIAVGI